MSDAYLAEELGQEYSSYDERDILKFGGKVSFISVSI